MTTTDPNLEEELDSLAEIGEIQGLAADPSADIDIEGFGEPMLELLDDLGMDPSTGSDQIDDDQAALDGAAAVRYRRVSGRYSSCPEPWELTLRVDVDGYQPTRRLSGDYHRKSGTSLQYFGSFIVDAVSISVSSTMIRLVGIARTTWSTTYNKLWVWIPRHTTSQPAATAYALWTTSANKTGARYRCLFDSSYFRTVVLEQDVEANVSDPFGSYNTGSLPSGGPPRVLSIAGAYQEAGVSIANSPYRNKVSVAPGKEWDNAELHAAMEANFRYWRNNPQWRVWYLHANKHVYGSGLYGIMFDQKDRQRQGCAGFYQGVGGTSAVKRRDQLYVGVHELGHCFNLYHSFHKSYMKPPLPNRPGALSWMNYPGRYKTKSTSGAAAFWNAFPFQFDRLERIHIRHAFRNNIIFGGNPFGTGASVEVGDEFADVVEDHSGLQLELSGLKDSILLGEPAIVQIKLRLRDLNGVEVVSQRQLHPNFGHVQLAIQRPGGDVVPFSPPLHHCAAVETAHLDEGASWAGTAAYIGYDGDVGQVFDRAGPYRLRAVYYSLDGSIVMSNAWDLVVEQPASDADRAVSNLMLGDEQGMLLYLLGSDSPSLASGTAKLTQVVEDHGDHPLALYAKLAIGNNLGRKFGVLEGDGSYSERAAEPGEAAELLGQVIDGSQDEGAGLDDGSVLAVMNRLAAIQSEAGDDKKAKATLKKRATFAEDKDLSAQTIAGLESED